MAKIGIVLGLILLFSSCVSNTTTQDTLEGEWSTLIYNYHFIMSFNNNTYEKVFIHGDLNALEKGMYTIVFNENRACSTLVFIPNRVIAGVNNDTIFQGCTYMDILKTDSNEMMVRGNFIYKSKDSVFKFLKKIP